MNNLSGDSFSNSGVKYRAFNLSDIYLSGLLIRHSHDALLAFGNDIRLPILIILIHGSKSKFD